MQLHNQKLKNKEKNDWQKVIGLILLIPPILSVLFFFLANIGLDWDVVQMRNLSAYWTARFDEGGGMSAAPIYLGLMAIAGAYLIKE